MDYIATITNFQFRPMVEDVDSYLDIWITTQYLGHDVMLSYQGSIEDLSKRFQFKIEGPASWDFTGFKGKKINARYDDKGYHFLSFA